MALSLEAQEVLAEAAKNGGWLPYPRVSGAEFDKVHAVFEELVVAGKATFLPTEAIDCRGIFLNSFTTYNHASGG